MDTRDTHTHTDDRTLRQAAIEYLARAFRGDSVATDVIHAATSVIDHHRFSPFQDDDAIRDTLDRIERKLDRNFMQETRAMADVKDIQARVATLAADVAKETEVKDSTLVLIKGLVDVQTDLRAQLAAAIAANDPTAVQAVLDAMDAAHTTTVANMQALVDAVPVNTPSA